jgi:hypothetical protein
LPSAKIYSTSLSLSYGGALSVWPFGELLGLCAETKGVTILAGESRSELFAYLGTRLRLFERFRPAFWVTLPFGSLRTLTQLRLEAELRVDLPF